jgi:hypothetical protein
VTEADRLQALTVALEEAAVRLRDGELAPEEAAALAEECARLAGEAAAELDRRGRAAADPGT